MYVKKNSCKNGRILLTLTHGYRENGKIRQKNVETLGYLDDLEKICDDPIAYFRKIAKQRTQAVASQRLIIDQQYFQRAFWRHGRTMRTS